MSHIEFQHCPICRSTMQHSQADGYNHCSEEGCGFTQFMNPTPVVAAVVEYEENHVILAHNALWPAGWLGLITGFVEKHENPDETVIREVKEELNLDAELVSLIGHYTFKRMNQLIIAYHLRASGEITMNEELDLYEIIPFDKAQYWPAGTGYALRDFLIKRGYKPMERSFR